MILHLIMDHTKKPQLKRQMAFYKETCAFDVKKDDVNIPIVKYKLDLPECNKDNTCEECITSKKLEEEYKTEMDKCVLQ